MRIHKAGFKIIVEFTIIFAALIALAWSTLLYKGIIVPLFITFCSVVLECFVIYFFRFPKRVPVVDNDGALYAPADGEVVVVEPVYEDEYLKDEVIQISIFMSLFNVHANFFPISGKIEYFKHHKGNFLVAWHPKSSTENERTTIVVRTSNDEKILFRQIAGFIARRIVSYASFGKTVTRGKQCGFIKFGSRVDVFVPLGTHILVEIGNKTIGSQTKIAQLPRCK